MKMTSGELNKLIREMIKNGKANKIDSREPRGKEYIYFAYGSNMDIAQMKRRCPQAIPLTKATLYNAKLVFKKYADVENERKRRSFVQGALYSITKKDMDALDRYEGYPIFYKKVKCVVQGPFNNYYKAFMYVMQKGVREYELPSEEYFNTIATGYNDWKLSIVPLCKAWEDMAVKLGRLEKMEVR